MIITVDCSDRYREDASDSMERVKPSPRARYFPRLPRVLMRHGFLMCHTVMNMVVRILLQFQ